MGRFENLVRDARLSLRSLAGSPGFALVAVASLALGIGAATCVFSLANAILLRSLPLPNPQDLRLLQWSAASARVPSYDGSALVRGSQWTDAEAVSHPAFLALRARAAAEADLVGFFPLRDAAVTVGRESLVADGLMVSDNFLPALQVRCRAGRPLQPAEDYSGGAMSVVISHGWWRRFYGLDPGAVGRTVRLNGVAFTIAGVLEPGFSGVEPGRPTDFYVPLSAASPFLYTPLASDFHWFVRLMARMKPGGSDARLAAALGVALASHAGQALEQTRFQAEPGAGGLAYDRGAYRKPLLLMLAVVGVVLLAACANLAGLLLARGATRRHELAVRAALGGSSWRLFQQALTDSLALALPGGALGVLLAAWGRAPLARLLAGEEAGLRYDFSLDPVVLGFTLAVTIATALVAGLIPALRAGRTPPMGALRSHAALARPRLRTARALVIVQVCLALLVLTGAGLFVRTLANLTRLDAGFSMERLLLVGLNIRGGVDAQAHPAEFYDRAQAAVAALPGVTSAAVVEFPLLSQGGSSGNFSRFENAPAPEAPVTMHTRRLRVGETFFATMGIPVLRGRGLLAADSSDARKVVVVNERFVRSYLQDRDPIGLAFRMWDADWTIVGVCRDAKYADIREEVSPTAYFPYRQMFYSRFRTTHLRGASIAARTTLPPLALADAARRALAGVDPGVAVTAVTTQEGVRDRDIGRERLLAILCTFLAGVALLLSWIGLFGLMAYTVARRTGEIGIRMALGAARAEITRQVLGEALLLAAAGIAAGLPLSWLLARLVRSQLFGVTPGDPPALVAAGLALLATAAAAAWIPARRAQRVEPTEALRYDG